MKKIKFLPSILILLAILIITSGCSQDNMDNINIAVTNYPNEYIVKKLYAKHASITSVYPDGVDISKYKISKKQKKDFSKNDLFIYNGLLEQERDLAVELLDLNPNLKIIDTAYVLETQYSPEELWLNPSSLLMMAQNIRIGLEEYITSNYLKKEIDESYENLKVKLSELDADYRVAVENTNNKTIVVADPSLKYLEKFGLEVICLDDNATEKTESEVEKRIKDQSISYIYISKNNNMGQKATNLIEKYPTVKKQQLHKLDNISDNERNNNENYITIMNANLELIKQELYQ